MNGKTLLVGAAVVLLTASTAQAQRPGGITPSTGMLCQGNVRVLRIWDIQRADNPQLYDYQMSVEGSTTTSLRFGYVVTGFPATASLPSVVSVAPAGGSVRVVFGTGPSLASLNQPVSWSYDTIAPGRPNVTIRMCQPAT